MKTNILQETIQRVLREDKKMSNFLRRRLENLDYEVESGLNGPFGGSNICIFFKSDIEFFESVMENAIDAMYYNYFSHIDDNSGEWAHEYLDMVDYIRKKYQDKIMKHYNNNCVSGSIPIKESIRKVLREENLIPLAIRRRVSSDDIEEAFDSALEQNADSMNNPRSIIFKEKEHTTLWVFAKFVIDDMVTHIEQESFNDNNRVYFSDNEEDTKKYHEQIRKPLLKYYGKRIKEKYNEVKSEDINESVLKEETQGIKSFLTQIMETYPETERFIDSIDSFIKNSNCKKIEVAAFKYPALGLAVHNGVLFNQFIFKQQLPDFLFIVFHEIAHQYQYKKYGDEKMYEFYLDEIDVKDAAIAMKKIEIIADEFANRKVREFVKLGYIDTPNRKTLSVYKDVPLNHFERLISQSKDTIRSKNVSSFDEIAEIFYNMIKVNTI